ncbi:MAG TPA: phosphoribosyltransferase family protein, partial [Gemmatimonadales bacterium]|nr:phosphoribosyltransferase family protein [Gemmatimonadales bacterium]
TGLRGPAAGSERIFADRVEAGVALAGALARYADPRMLVLGLVRGGAPVAAEVARRLGAEFDVIVVRKLGAPGAPELAIGAITADGATVFNDDVIGELALDRAQVAAVSATRRREAEELERAFHRRRPGAAVEGRTVILVDDGLATGATMRAAVASVRRRRPGRVVVAVPVGSVEACAALRAEADEVVCLQEPVHFQAVGAWYGDFRQVTDGEVAALLPEEG